MLKKLYEDIKNYEPYCNEEKVEKEVMLKFIENEDDVLTRDNKIAHFTTSGWVVNKDRTKVLMIHHNIYNTWAWIGGHADGDADLRHVIVKEIGEETGVKNVRFISNDIYGLNIITVEHHIRRGEYVPSHLHFDIEFLLEADEKEKLHIQEDENSGVTWVDLNEIENLVEEEKMKPIYKRLTKKLGGFKND